MRRESVRWRRGWCRPAAACPGHRESRRFQKTLSPLMKACQCRVGPGLVAANVFVDDLRKLNTRKNADFAVRHAHIFCINATTRKPTHTNPWICCLETAVHDAVNSLQDCANVEHRSRSCLPRPRHHRSFASPVPTSACE